MAQKQPFTPESLFEMRGISDPQVAPDGRRVAYVEYWIETITRDGKEVPAYRSAIMLSDGPDQEPRRLTWNTKGNSLWPRFSPDGRYLAFQSTRDDENHCQLHVMDLLGGGDGRALTTPKTLSEGIGPFDWHPDGNSICFLSNGHLTQEEQEAERLHDEKVYEDRLPFKFDGAGLLKRRQQLWRIGLDGSGLEQLTTSPFAIESPRWSPTGDAIAYVSVAKRELEWTYITDLFLLEIESRETRQLTPSMGPLGSPVWSPDGRSIAFAGHNMRSGNATNDMVWTVSREGGEVRCLTETFDRSVGTSTMGDMRFVGVPTRLGWSGNAIFFTATDHGRTGIYRVSADGGTMEQIGTDGLSVLSLHIAAKTIAFGGETDARLPEVFSMAVDGSGIARRSRDSDTLMARFEVVPPRHLTLKGADGWELEGWCMQPRGAEDGRRHPLILYIHGGPHSDYGYGFFHEFQVLAAAGFGVLYVNPRGGRSYGEAFTDAVRGHYGEKDYDDLMCAADLAQTWDWVDPQRMGIMGGSYGGFMTNWAITHTDRFAAACTQRSISNWVSFAGTSDIGPEFSQEEIKTLPWIDEELMMSKSPIRYVKNVKTPTLILHQENDHRCPIEQGEQLYTALVVLGVPTKFVRFPNEGHDLSRGGQPQRRVNRLNHIVDWFTRYLKPAV